MEHIKRDITKKSDLEETFRETYGYALCAL